MAHAASFRPVNPPGAGIPNMSQAILVETGKLLFLSGHVPMLADGSFAGPDLAAQVDQTFANMAATLAQAGTDFSKVVRLTIYMRDLTPEALATFREVRNRYINLETPPASAIIGVAELYNPAVSDEIEAIAVVP